MKGYSTFSKAPALQEPHQSNFLVSYLGLLMGVSYSSAEVQSMYSTDPAEWVIIFLNFIIFLFCLEIKCFPNLLGNSIIENSRVGGGNIPQLLFYVKSFNKWYSL